MYDVIGAYQRLEQMYRLYLKSAFPLRSPLLGEERDRVLMRQGVLRDSAKNNHPVVTAGRISTNHFSSDGIRC